MSPRPLVSVVVPTRNSGATLAPCLTSIRAQSWARTELIVVDRDSTDDTRAIARASGAVLLQAGPERSAQRNAGAREARGSFLLFVDSDMVLDPAVVERCVEQVPEGAAGILPEVGFANRFLTRVRSLEKQLYAGDDLVEAARFFPREPFVELGGYDEGLTGPEDWDLTDRWRASGRSVVRVDAPVTHDDRALTVAGLLRKRFWYGRNYVPFVRLDRRRAGRHLTPARLLPVLGATRRQPVLALSLLALKGVEAVAFGAGVVAGAVGGAGRERHGRGRT